jgi:hypothetical protein
MLTSSRPSSAHGRRTWSAARNVGGRTGLSNSAHRATSATRCKSSSRWSRGERGGRCRSRVPGTSAMWSTPSDTATRGRSRGEPPTSPRLTGVSGWRPSEPGTVVRMPRSSPGIVRLTRRFRLLSAATRCASSATRTSTPHGCGPGARPRRSSATPGAPHSSSPPCSPATSSPAAPRRSTTTWTGRSRPSPTPSGARPGQGSGPPSGGCGWSPT